MPRRDGTGPMGQGALTGRGLGPCNVTGRAYCGRGIGYGRNTAYCGRGFGRGLGYGYAVPVNTIMTKESLEEEKAILQERLNTINKELDNK